MFPPGLRQTVVLERRKKNHFLEESLLIVLSRGRQELPKPRTVLYYWGVSKHSVTRETESPPTPALQPGALAMDQWFSLDVTPFWSLSGRVGVFGSHVLKEGGQAVWTWPCGCGHVDVG